MKKDKAMHLRNYEVKAERATISKDMIRDLINMEAWKELHELSESIKALETRLWFMEQALKEYNKQMHRRTFPLKLEDVRHSNRFGGKFKTRFGVKK